ncbi:MAG TPA: zf-HC2 domain-containing protein [Ktedonobacteraceae bacterium]|jgi:anti-sigma factor RsiW|nr:zf-HC2 domain-containing protein [Ktedonobacteraceae bacterium]
MPIDDESLTCQQVVELITDYLENVLLAQTRKRLEEHMANCPGCETYMEQIRQTINLVHTLAEEPASPETKQELLQLFRKWKQE